MPNNQTTIWDNETIDNDPPVTKKVRLHCPGLLNKVELSFKFDVSNFQGCILDELKPILINDEVVPLQLPADKIRLKLVDMAGVDVTKFVKASVGGEINTITVNYKVRSKPWFFEKIGKKDVGKLRLSLMLHWYEENRKCSNGHEIPPGEKDCPICSPQTKYCMWHGEPVQSKATVCPFQGGPKYETVVTPNTQKICPNPACKKRIHVKEIFCEYCGTKEPLTPTS